MEHHGRPDSMSTGVTPEFASEGGGSFAVGMPYCLLGAVACYVARHSDRAYSVVANVVAVAGLGSSCLEGRWGATVPWAFAGPFAG